MNFFMYILNVHTLVDCAVELSEKKSADSERERERKKMCQTDISSITLYQVTVGCVYLYNFIFYSNISLIQVKQNRAIFPNGSFIIYETSSMYADEFVVLVVFVACHSFSCAIRPLFIAIHANIMSFQ